MQVQSVLKRGDIVTLCIFSCDPALCSCKDNTDSVDYFAIAICSSVCRRFFLFRHYDALSLLPYLPLKPAYPGLNSATFLDSSNESRMPEGSVL